MLLLWCAMMTTQVAAAPPEIVAKFEERKLEFTGGKYEKETFKYRLLTPANIEAGKQYPVVLFLHGAGERGTDNAKQLSYFPERMATAEMREKYPCFVIAPQCHPGEKWSNVNWGDTTSKPIDAMPTGEMQAAIQMLENLLAADPHVDPARVYLTGLSMGGYGSWDLAVRHPDWFAAVVPICGGGDVTAAEKLIDLPIWAFHGDADSAVPVARSRSMIAAIEKAGGKPKYTELKGVGHNSWTPAYSDPEGVIPWMFSQVNTRRSAGKTEK